MNYKQITFSQFKEVFERNLCNWTHTASDLNTSVPTLHRKFKGKYKVKVVKL